MKPKKYRAVLWDWDGTLFDSDMETWRAHCLALAHHNFATEPYETFRHREGNGISRSLGRAVPESTAEEVRRTFFQHYDISKCNLMDGAREVIRHLESLSVPCGIVSAHRVDEILLRLEYFQIAHHFPHVVGGMRDKQNALVEACTALGVSSSEALFVGDLLSDVLDGKVASLTTVLIAPTDSPHATCAHHHITRLDQLIQLLEF